MSSVERKRLFSEYHPILLVEVLLPAIKSGVLSGNFLRQRKGASGDKLFELFEKKGLKIAAMKFMQISRTLAEEHYSVHKEKPFYNSLLEFITAGPVVVLALEGERIIDVTRKMMGATFGFKAEPGTIRGDYGISNQYNLVHGSDSLETVQILEHL